MFEYESKIVLVTGAARGIGQAIAIEFAAVGAIVVMADIQKESQEATATLLRSQGHKAFAYGCDVTIGDSVSAFASAVVKDLGCPDIIYNNAVICRSGGILNLDLENLRNELDVNVLGYVRVAQAFLPYMIERGSGWIINTASPNAFVPPPMVAENLMGYCITKAADVSMSVCMSMTLKPKGIDVSLVIPDITYTDSVKELSGTASSDFHKGFADFITNRGRPSDVVAARIVEKMRQGGFFINVYDGFEDVLKTWVEREMDPSIDYFQQRI